MAPRFKGLTQSEIDKLMNDFEENYADSDSDCEMDEVEIEENDSFHETNDDDKNDDKNNGKENNDDIENEEHDNDTINEEENNDDLRNFEWKVPSENDTAHILPFTGNPGITCDADQLNNAYDYFKLIFTDDIINLICKETNRYAEQVLELKPESSGKRKHSPEWIETNPTEMEKFFGLILLMGHIEKDSIRDYWTTDKFLETPIFRKIMSRDRFLSILKYLHFSNNHEKPRRDSENYDRLWKIRQLFEVVNATFKEIYNPTEAIAIDEVIIKFKGRFAFRQYIPKKRKQWGIKLYKLADKTGYTYDMKVYLGNDKSKKNVGNSASYNVVTTMTECVKGKGHKLYMDNFFSSPQLYTDLFKEKYINSCGTIRCNRKNYPKEITQGKLKRGEIVSRFSNGLIAMRWKDKRDVYMLSNMHHNAKQTVSPDNSKPIVISDYNENMGYVDLSDRMANSYSFQRRTLKWTKKLFFHLFDISILNAYLLSQYKGTHRNFRMELVRNLTERNEMISRPVQENSSKHQNVEGSGSGHWPLKAKNRRRCAACSKNGIERRSAVICKLCNVALCIDRNCFEDYHNLLKNLHK